MRADGLPHKPALLADSLALGVLAVLMAFGAVACTLAGFGEPAASWKEQLASFLTFCTPPLALLNMYFSYRDEKRGFRGQARLGLALSLFAPVLSVLPLLFAD